MGPRHGCKAQRFDRLLLGLAWAYLLWVRLGPDAQAPCHPGHWSTAGKAGLGSVLTIGRRMLGRLELAPSQALAPVAALLSSGPK